MPPTTVSIAWSYYLADIYSPSCSGFIEKAASQKDACVFCKACYAVLEQEAVVADASAASPLSPAQIKLESTFHSFLISLYLNVVEFSSEHPRSKGALELGHQQ